MDGTEPTQVAARPFGRGEITLLRGNIMTVHVDAIVNAANTYMLGGGGVDGAIHRAAGPALLAECKALPSDANDRRCATGEVRVTGAGNLRAKYVIHAVGPFFNERYADKGDRQLEGVHVAAFRAANERGCRSVALPAISTGAYRFPVPRAAAIALRSAVGALEGEGSLVDIRFVLYTPSVVDAFCEALQAMR